MWQGLCDQGKGRVICFLFVSEIDPETNDLAWPSRHQRDAPLLLFWPCSIKVHRTVYLVICSFLRVASDGQWSQHPNRRGVNPATAQRTCNRFWYSPPSGFRLNGSSSAITDNGWPSGGSVGRYTSRKLVSTDTSATTFAIFFGWAKTPEETASLRWIGLQLEPV